MKIEWTLSSLHSSLVTQPPTMDTEWKNRIKTAQFPSASKRGGLGFGGHAKIALVDSQNQPKKFQFCNTNLFGSYFSYDVLSFEKTADDFSFDIFDNYSKQKIGIGTFFKPQAWYNETLSDGTPITNVLQAHMGKEAVSIIGNTRCVGFENNTACIYCNLQGGAGNPSRKVEQIIEALEVALQFGWKPASLALTTTWIGETNPVERMAKEISLIKNRFPNLPIAFEAQALVKNDYALLKKSGVNTIMIPIDSLENAKSFTLIKAGLTDTYLSAFEVAKQYFPTPGTITCPLVVGFDSIITTLGLISTLVDYGVKPEPIPIRWIGPAKTRIYTNSLNLDSAKNLTRNLWEEKFKNARVAAGCSQCGGCSGV